MLCLIHCLFYGAMPQLFSFSMACTPVLAWMDSNTINRLILSLSNWLPKR